MGEVGKTRSTGSIQPERGESIGFGIRKRLEQDSIDHAEYRRVGADTDGEGEKNRDCKAWSFAQAAKSEAEIGEEGLECRPLPGFAAALPDESDIAQFAARGLLSQGPCHPLFFKFVGALVDVFLDRDVDVVVTATAIEQAGKKCHPGPL